MSAEDKQYLRLIVFQIVIGLALFLIESFSKVYAVGIIVYGAYVVINSRNRNQEALYVAGYVIGVEVLLRMTNGNILYEYGKYICLFMLLLGIYFKGFSKGGVPYWLYLLLLVPGLIIATQTLGPDTNMRKTISFNISGPVCLGVAALYCYRRPVTQKQVYEILKWMGLPIISTAVFLIFKTPNLRESITGTASNFATSGGFGPNQVATILGLGMFIFFSRAVFCSPTRFLLLLNLIIGANIAFRGLITFSRGGMITGIVMLCVLLAMTYLKVNMVGKWKIKLIALGGIALCAAVWLYSLDITGGLIEKRYANQDAAGRTKESNFSGREELAQAEIDDFLSSPFFGIGVAKGAELRIISGQGGLSHNELTRMLAEHGALGILGLIIIIVTPLVLYLGNRNHFFLLAFMVFWLLTINHAAMRIAAPAFVYALSLLKVVSYDHNPPSVHRQ